MVDKGILNKLDWPRKKSGAKKKTMGTYHYSTQSLTGGWLAKITSVRTYKKYFFIPSHIQEAIRHMLYQ
jgi:hypothetical protein